jgi:uncharacterized protein DUF4384
MTSCSCILVGSSIAMAAVCAAAPPPVQPRARGAVSPERGGSDPPGVGSDERGMTVESAPFVLQIGVRIHGSKEGPLSDGDTIMTDDRIQVFTQTTEDAHLYLAYCAEDRKLAVFPSHGSISTPAGTTTVAPGKDASLVVDDRLGSETLYVIMSRADLVTTDPRLADAIHAAQSGGAAADCGPRFQRAVTAGSLAGASGAHPGPAPESTGSSAGPRPSTADDASLPKRSAVKTSRVSEADRRPPQDPRDRRHRIDKAGAGVPGDPPLRHVSSADDDEPPVVTIERGMYVGQNGLAEVTTKADANGIVILRYRFNHIAVPRP